VSFQWLARRLPQAGVLALVLGTWLLGPLWASWMDQGQPVFASLPARHRCR
jgi:hypothetical protein